MFSGRGLNLIKFSAVVFPKSFNALNDKVSKVFNLSLELESKRIITRAIILILVKNTGENTTKGLLLYFI